MSKSIKLFTVGLLVGAGIMLGTSSLANTVMQYVLVKAEYPIVVNYHLYESDTLPVLNYQGSTYVPLRATSDLLGAQISWDQEARQVNITTSTLQNAAFRYIEVSGSDGQYTITGEARVYEATVSYEVEDGHFILKEGFTTASAGGPEWGIFSIEIDIAEQDLPEYGSLRIILYEESAKDGSRKHELAVPLQDFN